MSVRLRRLKADYDKLCTLFTQKSKIRIKKSLGNPPEKYQLEYLVSSIEKTIEGRIVSRNTFLIEITLTGSYPRMAPQCKMLTPVFHPNIAPHAICIGDHWAAGEALSNLVIRIGEMLAFQSYNLQSPLNGEAAKWVDENKASLPLDNFDFTSLLSIGEAVSRTTEGNLNAGGVCANCGKAGKPGEMQVCGSSHVTCTNCVLNCPVCNDIACLKCQLLDCAICKQSVCQKCSYKCQSCGHTACAQHQGSCVVCEHGRCAECLVDCAVCGKHVCMDHITKMTNADGSRGYSCHRCAGVL